MDAGYVLALAVSGSNLYAGGIFTTAGGVPANYIAKWNGSSWSALGSGMNNWVQALAVSGSDLYAGGSFTTAGGTTANSIAKWNGNSWAPLDSGMGGSFPSVWALAALGSDLYAGVRSRRRAAPWPITLPNGMGDQQLVQCQLPPHHQRRDQKRQHSHHARQPVFQADWKLSAVRRIPS
jgi:hypothetical protein